jgi:hypothetical protein
VKVRIERNSSPNTILVDYENGSLLDEATLDLANRQSFYLAQEAEDRAQESIAPASDTNWDAGGKRIKNVGTPTDAADAVTKAYADTIINTTAGSASAAAASAVAADASADAAAAEVVLAAAQVALAEAQVELAEDQVDLAAAQVVIATTKAAEAAASAANLPNATAGGADRWLKINGSANGWVYRTNAEVLSDIGAQAALGYTAANDALVAKLATSQTFTAGQTPQTAALTDGATVNWNCANAQVATLTATAARTFAAPTNQVANRFYALMIHNSGGAFAHAFNAAFIFDSNDGTPGSFPAGARLHLTFRSDGTSLREWGRRIVAS